jgi:hypothetical protein
MGMPYAAFAAVVVLSVPTVKCAEGSGSVAASASAIAAMRCALDAVGVEFIPENGGGPGASLRK